MKKLLSLLLIALLVTANFIPSFADTSGATVPTDIKGTKYEEAVTALINQSIITGYEDGTFKPEATITRAEACIVIVKGLATSDAALSMAKDSAFSDLSGYSWAKKYINYAAEKGVIDGYGDNTFKPGTKISYNEMAAMLVKALGYKESDLTGTWPDNYMKKATELGMMTQLNENSGFNATDTATRGSVALMTKAILEKLQNLPTIGGAAPATDLGSPKAGKLKDFTGNATGMILGYSKIVNSNKETAYEIEFLMGKDTLYINTDTSCNMPNSIAFDGSVYTLKMVSGVIKDISSTGGKLKHFSQLTSGWKLVDSRDARIVTINGSKLTIMKDAVFYKASFSGTSIADYEKASLSDIEKGCLIKAYDATDDDTANADIVIIVQKTDASKI